MSSPPLLPDEFRRLLLAPVGGIPGLVDGVLALCRHHELDLDWAADECRIRLADGSETILTVPLRTSIFRAVLARFAVLCNERRPKSVSLYGGDGEVEFGQCPPVVFRVKIQNARDAQRVVLVRAPASAPVSNGPTTAGASAQTGS